jgi:S1-C subfamily serine protease
LRRLRARSGNYFWGYSPGSRCKKRLGAVWAIAGALGLLACGEPEGSAVDPGRSVVAIGATGCRPVATRAVGVVIADDLVATVAHAVAGESDITVVTPTGREMKGTLVAIDTDVDAALIDVDGIGLPPLRRAAYAGDGASAVSLWTSADGTVESAPADIVRRVTVRTTDIYREGDHLRPGFELRADVEPGDSGGGIVDRAGDLVGLVWATSRERPDRAWALPIEALDPLLDSARRGETPAAVPCAR